MMVQSFVIAVFVYVLEEKLNLGIIVFWEWDTDIATGAVNRKGLYGSIYSSVALHLIIVGLFLLQYYSISDPSA